MQTLETPRLILRQFTQSDLDALEAILGDPVVMQFSVLGVMNCEQRQQWLDGQSPVGDHRQILSYQARKYWMYAVVAQSSGQLIGFCGLTVLEIDRQKEIEMGYRFAQSHWGKGFATEAAQAIRNYGFGELKLNRLICIIEAANGRSIRVAEKIGMYHEKDTHFHNIPVRIYAAMS